MNSSQHDWIRDARVALRDSETDFFRHKRWAYWSDFLLSTTIAYSAATVFLAAPIWWLQLLAFPAAVFWLYRAGSLVHEVAHLPRNEMRVFKVVWNVAVGVPLLTPSTFFTCHHRDHHTRRLYGTPHDPEYVVNVCRPGSWGSIALYAMQIALFPPLVLLRFLLAPLTFLHPRLRSFVLRHASSFTMNWRYERKISQMNHWAFISVELLCWLRAVGIALLLTGIYPGVDPWVRVMQLYLLAASILLLNQMRQLADHHFQSEGEKLSLADHVLDSCNFSARDPLTWLFFPYSIRYHALHHLFPSLPYHNLKTAHAHLLQELPADSPYRSLDQPGWWSVARRILRTAA